MTANLQLTGKRAPDDSLDSFAEIRSLADASQSVVLLRPEPRVTEKMGGSGVSPPVACDTTLSRFYVGSPLLGYIVAFRGDGTELWRSTLPKFQSAIGLPLDEPTAEGFAKLLDSEGSVLARLIPMGEFVAAAYRVKSQWYDAIYHRSGVAITVIGPWDGVLMGAESDGWLFDAGGEAAHGHWKLPTEELGLRFRPAGPGTLIEHFLRWNLPRPDDTQWIWRKCAGDNRFVRLDLGPRFDPRIDDVARRIHDELGAAWAEKMVGKDAMSKVLFRGDLPYHEWKEKVRLALLNGGADVDCARYATEHHLLESWDLEPARGSEWRSLIHSAGLSRAEPATR